MVEHPQVCTKSCKGSVQHHANYFRYSVAEQEHDWHWKRSITNNIGGNSVFTRHTEETAIERFDPELH